MTGKCSTWMAWAVIAAALFASLLMVEAAPGASFVIDHPLAVDGRYTAR